MEKTLLNIETITEYNDRLGVETLHPQVSVIDLAKARPMRHMRHTFSFYVVFLKDEKNCDLIYGRQRYDYQKGSVVCLAPGQVIGIEDTGEEFQPRGYALCFHPDLIRGTHLGRHIGEYTFFSYEVNEALHLSERERTTFINCLSAIREELAHDVDRMSRRLLVTQIELLLDYCLRFYDRQFITREEINHSVVKKFISLLDEYIARKAEHEGLPTVAYFADKCCYSTKYFGELVKTETGRTAKSMINDRLLSAARQLLVDETLTITQVSQRLGFEYSQHFVRFFKAQTGKTPSEYRKTA